MTTTITPRDLIQVAGVSGGWASCGRVRPDLPPKRPPQQVAVPPARTGISGSLFNLPQLKGVLQNPGVVSDRDLSNAVLIETLLFPIVDDFSQIDIALHHRPLIVDGIAIHVGSKTNVVFANLIGHCHQPFGIRFGRVADVYTPRPQTDDTSFSCDPLRTFKRQKHALMRVGIRSPPIFRSPSARRGGLSVKETGKWSFTAQC
jgi:hypothetical protein